MLSYKSKDKLLMLSIKMISKSLTKMDCTSFLLMELNLSVEEKDVSKNIVTFAK